MHGALTEGAQTVRVLRGVCLSCAVLLCAYLAYAFTHHLDPVSTIVVCFLLVVFLAVFTYLMLSSDPLRSQYTERSLSIASDMLEDIRDGLTREGAMAVCRRLLSETRAMTVAVTDTESVLACAGDLADDFPPGSMIHTPATHYAIEHGLAQSFTRGIYRSPATGEEREIPAGIVAPLRVRDTSIGALKFYFRSPRDVDRTQYALAAGYAELISTQLAIHELERQEELVARAELRALQAQINPHFLFNTLNTMAALTRTDPARARELLREFASFYRSTLETSGSLIPVEREIAQTKRYLLFEKARFGDDRIVDTFEIDPGAREAQVPAFVIQPLVENSVRHAMRMEGALHVRVSVHATADDAIDIEVTDDGVGMDEATASRLFARALGPMAADQSQGGGAGIAMHNIHERIKRFYGPGSSAKAVSVPGSGTTIALHLDLRGSIFS
ncbi:histidine kinase [Collinsella sp. AGMB00827]|uniref:histidine kinase n=2 Tax=Collinsella ureilytica TaxID=2869515 RepID=A0ABS7MJS8_9ACTN|nr:histidine kinase [Collinsella urealyticum]